MAKTTKKIIKKSTSEPLTQAKKPIKSPSKASKSIKTPTKTAIAAKPIHKKVVAEIVEDDNSDIRPPEADDDYSAEEFDTSAETPDIKSLLPAHIPTKEITSTDPLVLYLNEVRRYPVPSREQEQEIAKKYYDTKDPEAAQTLVRSNLRFVIKVAAEYSRFGAKMIDLIQEGNVGLMQAVKDFNPYKGNRLITYAVWWIRGYIQEYLMKQYSIVRIGTTQNQRKLFYQLQKEKESLDKMLQSQQIGLLSHKLDIPENEVRVMVERMSGRDVSLDKPVGDESGSSFQDFQTDSSETPMDEKFGHAEELHMLHDILEDLRPTLNERENILLQERLLSEEPLTLQEIGEKYGITREAVRQAEVRLMKKIKDKMAESLHLKDDSDEN